LIFRTEKKDKPPPYSIKITRRKSMEKKSAYSMPAIAALLPIAVASADEKRPRSLCTVEKKEWESF
jgi:hypothetical protein